MSAAGREGGVPSRRLLYVAVNLNPPGGGQCVGAWALQSLREEWQITILCAEPPDYAALNRHFGTSLVATDFSILQAPWLIRQTFRFDPDPYSFQRAAWLMRMAQNHSRHFDVVLGTDNEMDFGPKGIQYVHYPYLFRHKERVDAVDRVPPMQRIAAVFSGRYRPWMLTSRIRFERVQANLTLVNSAWTAQVVRDRYGQQPTVLYPPVRWPPVTVPWSQRDDAFVSLGRIETGKRQLEAIDILERVRRRGHAVRLEIIGDIFDPEYARLVTTRAREAGSWVRLHHGIERSRLEEIVGNCRYGLHTMLDEHFGIAVAEMVRAGCIVFVPDSGGQVEIVGDEAALQYGSDDAAVERICGVLENAQEQARLLQGLAGRRDLFSETAFGSRLRQLVDDFAGQQPG